jgi:hypothetical protein
MFKIRIGLDGCTVDFTIPRGHEGWAFGVTLFAVGDKVVVVESDGPTSGTRRSTNTDQAAPASFQP